MGLSFILKPPDSVSKNIQQCICLKESTCETRKNVFHFTSKAFFVLEIIKFKLFRYSNAMTSSNAQACNTKHILLSNLGSKHTLLMKFGQSM